MLIFFSVASHYISTDFKTAIMQHGAPGRQRVSFDAGMGCICPANYLGLLTIWRLSLSSPHSKFMELTCRKIIVELYNCVRLFEKSLRSKCTTSL